MSKIIIKDSKRSFAITADLANTPEGADLIAEAILSGLPVCLCK